MNIIFVLLATCILFVFMFKRNFLYETKPFIIILSVSFILFLIYVLLKSNGIEYKNYQAFAIPLMQLIIFFMLSKIYKYIFGKNPEDTFWTMDKKLMKDGIFNFLFWVLAISIPVIVAFKYL